MFQEASCIKIKFRNNTTRDYIHNMTVLVEIKSENLDLKNVHGWCHTM